MPDPKTPPVVTPEQQLQIRNFELEIEVLRLRAEGYLQSLRVEGYQLQRDPHGRWVFVPLMNGALKPEPEAVGS